MAKKDGERICLEFTEPITSDVSDQMQFFTVKFYQPYEVNGAELVETTRVPSSIENDGKTLTLIFPSGNVNSIQNAIGEVTVSYLGGTLSGDYGPVSKFSISFTPEELETKAGGVTLAFSSFVNYEMNIENIQVFYSDYLNAEYVCSNSFSIIHQLTHIDDL